MSTHLPAGMLTGKNRRASPRHLASRRIRVQCRSGTLGLGPNCATSLWDLSQTGARIVATTGLPVNQEVELTLEGPSQQRPLKVEAIVVWQQPAEDNQYYLGLRLRKALPYAQLLALT